jgi:iron complex outermembrane receptor protein
VIAGVNVTGGGAPGADIRIRGGSSPNASNEPLIVLFNVFEYTTQVFLSTIDP